MKKLLKTDWFLIAVAVGLMLIVGVIEFLGKHGTITSGFEILMNQTANEWFWMIFGSVFCGGLVYAFYKYYQKQQDVPGNMVRSFAAAFMIFAGIAFGKACTDKANEGVTSGNGRPGGPAPVEDNRVPAEDLLPKK